MVYFLDNKPKEFEGEPFARKGGSCHWFALEVGGRIVAVGGLSIIDQQAEMAAIVLSPRPSTYKAIKDEAMPVAFDSAKKLGATYIDTIAHPGSACWDGFIKLHKNLGFDTTIKYAGRVL